MDVVVVVVSSATVVVVGAGRLQERGARHLGDDLEAEDAGRIDAKGRRPVRRRRDGRELRRRIGNA